MPSRRFPNSRLTVSRACFPYSRGFAAAFVSWKTPVIFFTVLLVLTLPRFTPAYSPPATVSFQDIYESSRSAVVNIQGDKVDETEGAWEPGRGAKMYKGMGTGIIIDPRGYIVTNHHVIAEIRKIQVSTLDKKTYTAVLIAKDLETDLALIKITPETPLSVIKIGRASSVRVCDPVLAIGNPYGYDYTGTCGTVSGLGRDVEVDETLVYRNAIQLDVSINPGNSGGPLINAAGEMIGINVAIRQGAVGTAFAMPVDQVVAVAAKLIGEHTAKSIWHGLVVGRLDREFSDESNPTEGLLVLDVEPESPADLAGIEPMDVLLSINESPVASELDFQRAFIGLKSKSELSLDVVREEGGDADGQKKQRHFVFSLANPGYNVAKSNGMGRSRTSLAPGNTLNRADASGKIASQQGNDPVWETLGFQATPLTKEEFQRRYATFLPLYPGGVVVKSLKADSPFMTAGVRVGDVIVGMHTWSIVSQKNLVFMSEQWPDFAHQGSIRIWLLRGNKHFFQDIPVK